MEQNTVSQHHYSLAPVDGIWDSWFKGEGCTTDFMSRRDQPADQERTSEQALGLRVEDWVP